ncbi:MAG: ATP-binding cassette domain-containing protein [Microbacterium sp.]
MRIVATDVGFSYHDRVIAKDVALCVGVGESIAIVGPSGVGKSTLLGLLGGAVSPTSGSIDLEGSSSSLPDAVSWVFQTLNVLRDRTVIDNVELGALRDDIDRGTRRRRSVAALARVGLDDRVNAPVRTLSGGELQRVVIARALASERAFILADEPTGQLDSETTSSVIGMLTAVKRDRGVVIVTHDPEVARRCDRIYRMDSGHLTETRL